jgi:hypothetical protein
MRKMKETSMMGKMKIIMEMSWKEMKMMNTAETMEMGINQTLNS